MQHWQATRGSDTNTLGSFDHIEAVRNDGGHTERSSSINPVDLEKEVVTFTNRIKCLEEVTFIRVNNKMSLGLLVRPSKKHS